MNAESAAERHYDRHGCEDTNCALEAAWESFIESAAEDERFTDEDGEWLKGFPEAFDDHPVWIDYADTFVSSIEAIISEVSSFAGWEDYYGTSRWD